MSTEQQPGEDAPISSQHITRWKSVTGAGRGPGRVCDLCGRERGGLDRNDPEASIFRRVRVNGAAESVTVCGRCYQERKP